MYVYLNTYNTHAHIYIYTSAFLGITMKSPRNQVTPQSSKSSSAGPMGSNHPTSVSSRSLYCRPCAKTSTDCRCKRRSAGRWSGATSWWRPLCKAPVKVVGLWGTTSCPGGVMTIHWENWNTMGIFSLNMGKFTKYSSLKGETRWLVVRF